MKKTLFILTMLLSTFTAMATEPFSGQGLGTAESPYEIKSASHLNEVHNYVNSDGVYFILKEDIDLEVYLFGLDWEPIGSESEPFKGVFLGNNHTISGLTINTSSNNQGLFGYISGVTIKDLTVEGTVKGKDKVGGIVGGSTATNNIENCVFNGNVSGQEYVGGIVGDFIGTLNNVTHFGNTKGYGNLGGIVGVHSSGSITDATNTGDVTSLSSGNNNYVGGVVGRSSCPITSAYSNGKVTGKQYIGGLAGAVGQSIDVNNCSVEGSVTGTSNTGGLIGYMEGENVSNCTSKCVVNGQEYTGGVIGNSKATISDCSHSDGTVSGTDYVGGLVGMSTASVNNSRQSDGEVTGANYVGGLIGQLFSGSVSSCYVYANIKGSENVGGITGCFTLTSDNFPQIVSSGFFGNISASKYVGGIVGQATFTTSATASDTKPNLVLHTYRTYGKTAYDDKIYKETLTDINNYVSILNCVSVGDIVGSTYVGGIVGKGLGGGYLQTTPERFPATAYLNDHSNYHTMTSIYYFYYKDGTCVNAGSHLTGENWWPIYASYNNYTYYMSGTNITDNFFSGSLKGKDYVGGVAGYMHGGSVNRNHSYAAIEGGNKIGGIVGYMQADLDYIATTISSNVALNNIVTAIADAGKVLGYTTGSYLDISTNGTDANLSLISSDFVINGAIQTITNISEKHGTQQLQSQLQHSDSYAAMGWDFDTGKEWTNDEDMNYPYKQWQTTPPTISEGAVKGSTVLIGTCTEDGTVYVTIDGSSTIYETACISGNWSLSVPTLKSGSTIRAWSKSSNKEQSYQITADVSLSGSGTEADPWLVSDADDLQGIAKNKGGYYKQMNDIDLTSWISANNPDNGWLPVGVGGESPVFYDGCNHKVTGLWVNSEYDCTGLFSSFPKGAIRNLTVEVTDKQIKGGDYVGTVIGRIGGGTIEFVKACGNIEAKGFVGGIAGYTESTALKQLLYTGKLSATGHVGGISSVASSAAITECEAKDIMIEASTSQYVGGLVAFPICAITKCKVTGTITLTGTQEGACVGGLAGRNTNNVSECTADVTISNASPSGLTAGLIAYTNKTVSLCCSSGSVTSTGSNAYTGGLVAEVGSNAVIENCYSTANVTGLGYVGGVAGYAYGRISKTYASGSLLNTGNDGYTGGIVGYIDGDEAIIKGCVGINPQIETGNNAWGNRIIGNHSDSPEPVITDNYGWNEMSILQNDEPKSIIDDPYEGRGKTRGELHQQNTYETLEWDFNNVWGILENETLPYLLAEIKQGDVNRDGHIDLTDAVCIVYYYLGELPGIFVEKTADMNGDGRIDLTDAIMVVYQYLGEGNAASARALLEEITENEPQ